MMKSIGTASLSLLLVFLCQATVLGETTGDNYLSLNEAITRALQANVNIAVARSRVEEGTGTKERAMSGYLPHLRIETPVAYQTRNLEAQGIKLPNSPSVIGPFTSYDFRIYGEQTLLDLQSYHNIRARDEDLKARNNDFEDVRSRTIRQVTTQYLAAQYAAAQVETAVAKVDRSTALEELARNQRDAGVADGLDVLRAQVQLANDRQNLLLMTNSARQTLLLLARTIGSDLGTPIILSDKLAFKPLAAPQVEEAIAALRQRIEHVIHVA